MMNDNFNSKSYSFDKPAKKKGKFGSGASTPDNYQRFLEYLDKSGYSAALRQRIVKAKPLKDLERAA